MRLKPPASPAGTARFVFWSTTIAVGVVGSPLLNRWHSEYVFLWPLVLWSALQLTALASVWAERQSNRRHARWVSRLAGLAFLGVNALYFHLCRKLGLSIEWGFLTGLLPAFPVAELCMTTLRSLWAQRKEIHSSISQALFDIACTGNSAIVLCFGHIYQSALFRYLNQIFLNGEIYS